MMRVRLLPIVSTLLIAGSAAFAAERIHDERKETAALAANGRVDIVMAARAGPSQKPRHTILMRKRVQPRRIGERPVVAINTRGADTSDPEYLVRGATVEAVTDAGPQTVGKAKLRSRARRWVYRFKLKSINAHSYGWAVLTSAGDAVDVAPAGHYARTPG